MVRIELQNKNNIAKRVVHAISTQFTESVKDKLWQGPNRSYTTKSNHEAWVLRRKTWRSYKFNAFIFCPSQHKHCSEKAHLRFHNFAQTAAQRASLRQSLDESQSWRWRPSLHARAEGPSGIKLNSCRAERRPRWKYKTSIKCNRKVKKKRLFRFRHWYVNVFVLPLMQDRSWTALEPTDIAVTLSHPVRFPSLPHIHWGVDPERPWDARKSNGYILGKGRQGRLGTTHLLVT